MSDRAKILIVDDHPILRKGLRRILEREQDLTISAEAANPRETFASISVDRPDLVLLDLTLVEGDGLDILKDLTIRDPDLPVLVLTSHPEELYAERCLQAGAKGYITKSEAPDLLIDAIRKVLGGHIYVSDKLSDMLLRRQVGAVRAPSGNPLDQLSDRELQVFQLIGEGLSAKEIGEKLHVGVKTIHTHRERIRKKLSLDSGAALLRMAIAHRNDQANPPSP